MRHSDRDTYSDTNRNPEWYADTFTDEHSNGHANGKPVRNADTFADEHSNSHANGKPVRNSDTFTDQYADEYTYGDPDQFTEWNPDGQCYCYANGHANTRAADGILEPRPLSGGRIAG